MLFEGQNYGLQICTIDDDITCYDLSLADFDVYKYAYAMTNDFDDFGDIEEEKQARRRRRRLGLDYRSSNPANKSFSISFLFYFVI